MHHTLIAVRRPDNNAEDGFVLNLTVWISALLFLSIMIFSLSSRSNALMLRNDTNLMELRQVTDAGLEFGLALFSEPSFIKDHVIDNKAFSMKVTQGSFHIKIEDEKGKFDINHIDPNVLRRLLENAGISVSMDRFKTLEIAKRLEQLNPSDKDGNDQEEQAEKKPVFRMLSDLQFVSGMTTKLYEQLEPDLTVYSGTSKINPRFAKYSTLAALPAANAKLIRRYIASRTSGEAKLELGSDSEAFLDKKSGPIFRMNIESKLMNGIKQTTSAYVFSPTVGEGVAPNPQIIEIF